MTASDPAFPCVNHNNYKETGLTKREYFAGLAMQGLVASPKAMTVKECIDIAVRCADTLLEALARPGDDG